LEFGCAEVLIHGVETGQNVTEVLLANGQHERETNSGVKGVTATDPVPETKHVGGVNTKLGNPLRVGGNSNKVLGHRVLVAVVRLKQPRARLAGIGQRLSGTKGLGSNNKQGRFKVKALHLFEDVGWVNVGNKLSGDAAVSIVT